MKYFMTWVICCALIFEMRSQTIIILDKANEEPVTTAAVSDPATGRVVFANKKGQADLSSFVASTTLQISSFGYKTVRINKPELVSQQNPVFYLEKKQSKSGRSDHFGQ